MLFDSFVLNVQILHLYFLSPVENALIQFFNHQYTNHVFVDINAIIQ